MNNKYELKNANGMWATLTGYNALSGSVYDFYINAYMHCHDALFPWARIYDFIRLFNAYAANYTLMDDKA